MNKKKDEQKSKTKWKRGDAGVFPEGRRAKVRKSPGRPFQAGHKGRRIVPQIKGAQPTRSGSLKSVHIAVEVLSCGQLA